VFYPKEIVQFSFTMERFATFIHISDLHFGPVDPNTMDSAIPRLWECYPWFDGLLGHSYHAAVKLDRFFGQMKQEAPVLIVTGDITACGSEDEYSTARDFLGDELRPPKGNYVGLGRTSWNDHAVSGNHDNWPGTPTIWGSPLSCKDEAYRRMPYYDADVLHLPHGYTLSLLGIDTDRDVSPHGWRRGWAQGAFQSQLAELVPRLPIPTEREIRVLLLHHSAQFTSRNPALHISKASKAALYDFAVKHNVRILLCGHTHLPKLSPFEVPYLGDMHPLFEGCCGATTRRTDLPPEATNWTGGRPARDFWRPNSLLVHRLFGDQGKIIWQTQVYFEKAARFVQDNSLDYEIEWPA
jgi:UDP-2,3-diacylglucosamine pyrophosphatase LpxH